MHRSVDEVLAPGFRLHWYQIQSLLGDGGFGITYLGRDTNLNQLVAIKEYFPKSHVRRTDEGQVCPAAGVDARFYRWGLQRFLEEARTLARFRHPHIVRVLSVFETLGTAYMVMELERGRSLSDTIKLGTIHNDDDVLDLCLPVLDGLDLVHHAGFIHRDIKPSNLLLRRGLGPVLIDFGSARQPDPGSSQLTAIVSRGYAPMEQYDTGNEERQGPWTDIYGMAATLYHAVTGAAPMDAVTRGMALLNGEPDPLLPAAEGAQGRFSLKLLAAIDRGLAFRVDERPQTVADWRELFPDHSSARRFRPQLYTDALDLPARGRAPRAEPTVPACFTGATAAAAVALPAADEEVTTVPNPEQAPSYRDRRVLVVDDELAARTLAQRVLGNLDVAEVEAVSSAEAVLARLCAGGATPEVLICDLAMPGTDGIQLLRLLAERRLQAPLVLMSEGDERLRLAAESLAAAHGLWVLGSIRKPLNPDELARILSRMDHIAPAQEDSVEDTRALIEDDELRQGIEGDALRLVYLPKVCLRTRELLGAEALVRWLDPVRGEVQPMEILPRVESLGLTDALTDAVLRKALAEAGQWRAAGLRAGLSINVFACSLARLDLPERLVALAESEGVDPSGITLEVNEVRFQQHREAPLEILARLRLRRVGLALDDFGTGASTLERLRRIPFTEIKADRSFVEAAAREQTSHAILESSVALAQRLGLATVAEGVKDQASWELTQSLGFDAAQGFFISPPLAADALVDWAKDWSAARLR